MLDSVPAFKHCKSSCTASRVLCNRGEMRGHGRRLLPLSSFQSQFDKSVSCLKAKRSFGTVWPGSPQMKTSNQALIVTNYISLYLCNLHCSNLIQAVLRLWKPDEAKEVPSTNREICVGDLSFPTGSILLHLPGLVMSMLLSQSTYVLLPRHCLRVPKYYPG